MANAPVLIDLHNLDAEQQRELNLTGLIECLRELKVVPVAVRHAGDGLAAQAVAAGVGILPASKASKEDGPEAEGAEDGPATATEAVVERIPAAKSADAGGYKTKIITQPVRSGQRVLAQGDLVILSSVNAGAEVLARGNIHVYGALRGRAMAGIEGDDDVRIFCMQCNPELIAVAGDYMVNESLDRSVVNQSVMVTRDADGLIFSPLNTGVPKH